MNNLEEQEDETYNQEEAKGLKLLVAKGCMGMMREGIQVETPLESLSSQKLVIKKRKL